MSFLGKKINCLYTKTCTSPLLKLWDGNIKSTNFYGVG